MDKKKKTSEVEYDPSLSQLLIDNRFDRGDISGILTDNGIAYAYKKSEKKKYMDVIRHDQQIGCIIILPWKGFFPDVSKNDPRTKWIVVFYSPLSTEEIRRRVDLKAFL